MAATSSTLSTPFLGETLRWGPGGFIPASFVDVKAAQLENAEHDDALGPFMGNVSGPPLLIAWRAFYVMIGIWAFAPIVTVWASRCDGDAALAVVPAWLFPALSVGVMVELFLEHEVRKFLIVPISKWLSGKTSEKEERGEITDKVLHVIGIPLPFCAWIVFNTAVSFAGHADIITNGITVGRAGKQCSVELEELWAHLMHNSVVGAYLGGLPFWSLTLTGWFLMASQWMLAWNQAKPLTGTTVEGRPIHYDMNSENPVPVYKTRSGDDKGHDDVLAVLMEVTRMSTISGPSVWVNMKQFQCCDSGPGVPQSFGMSMQRLVRKFAVVSVLENAFMLNVQAALLGVNRAVSGSVDLALLASILLGLLIGVKNLISEWQIVKTLKVAIEDTDMKKQVLAEFAVCVADDEDDEEKEFWRDYAECLLFGRWDDDEVWATLQERPCIKSGAVPREEGLNPSAQFSEGMRFQRQLPRTYASFLAVVGLYVALAARAAWVTVMVTMRCQTGLYDFGVGCLEIPSPD